MVPGVLRLTDDTAAGLIGAAGLDAHHRGVVVGAAGQQHLIGGILPQVVVLIGLPQLHGVVFHYGGKIRLLHGILRQDRHIPCGGIVVIAVQAGGVGKMGAQRLGTVVHHLHKPGDVLGHGICHAAAAHIPRQDHGGFIARLHQRRGEQLPDGQSLPDDQPAQGGVGAVQHILDPHGIFGGFVVKILYIFQHQYGGHDLGK